MTGTQPRLRGRLRLEVRDQRGRLTAARAAQNMVLRQGAALVAQLFTGQGAVPINTIRVGFGTEPLGVDSTALTGGEGIPDAALTTAVPPEAAEIITDRDDLVRVAISATFHPSRRLENVTEAGLMAGDVLYNQVIFEPVNLLDEQDVTFFWEIDFPFGHD